MPFYHQLGSMPQKKHVTFRKSDGSLYWEELFSTKGFSGIYSTLYHLHQPPAVESARELDMRLIEPWPEAPRVPVHFFTEKAPKGGDILNARQYTLYNSDCALATASFSNLDETFYRNAKADEILFVHHGSGELHTPYGVIPFSDWDYLVIPRGVIYRLENLSEDNQFLIVECYTPVETPKRYRNEFGQLLEDAPFSERDFRRPQWREPIDQTASQKLWLKSGERVFEYILKNHPFDVVGWDGYLYPYAFNIKNFQPIVGQIHLPPPIHQVFQTSGLVVCNFVPRLFDFHPDSVPAPYYHQNIDSDEVLYYVDGDFMSRKGIESGSITLHPGDVPHGPQPGKTEASIGVKDCYEYAVMVDTFKPLHSTRLVEKIWDENYIRSWLG